MERHPLIFLSVVVMIGVLNGLTLGYTHLIHNRLSRMLRLLHLVRNDTDELAKGAPDGCRRVDETPL